MSEKTWADLAWENTFGSLMSRSAPVAAVYEFRVDSYRHLVLGSPYRHVIPGMAHYLAYWTELDGGHDDLDHDDHANAHSPPP